MLHPPEKSTVFMGVVRANSRKIFEVEDKFSQNNYCFFGFLVRCLEEMYKESMRKPKKL